MSARETAELLLLVGRLVQAEGYQGELSPAQWMALRFFARANSFSRTPSALAEFAAAAGLFVYECAEPLQLKDAAQLMRKYADTPMDFADASLVLLAEHLGDGRILSTDQRDFGAYRWKNHKPFTNLLETPP